MKKYICLGIALIFAVAIIVGTRFDLYSYIQQVSNNLPSVSDAFNDLSNAVSNLQGADNVFFGIGQWFVMMWEWLILPIRLIAWIIKVITAVSPVGVL